MALSPALAQDAKQILHERNLPCKEVISVDSDSILYVNSLGARTAWLHRRVSGFLQVAMVEGFQCEPPEGWHER